jgi:chitin synthase
MRFVVALDLFATLTMPAACCYLVYLIYASIQSQTAPTISLIMLAVAYGLQMLIFILKRKFEHIGWMIISILAMPFFAFYLPLYAFWHFDDFSWGNTRRVAGSNGKELHVGDADYFDPAIIPSATWEKYVADVTAQHDKAEKTGLLAPDEQIQATVNVSVTTPQQISYQHPPYAGSDISGTRTSLGGSGYAPSALTYATPGYAGTYSELARTTQPQEMMMVVPATRDMMDMQAMANAMPVIDTQSTPASATGMPSDDEIVYQIRVLLSTHDLQSLTKKKVRDELSLIFGTDMSLKKQFIGDCVEAIINGEL